MAEYYAFPNPRLTKAGNLAYRDSVYLQYIFLPSANFRLNASLLSLRAIKFQIAAVLSCFPSTLHAGPHNITYYEWLGELINCAYRNLSNSTVPKRRQDVVPVFPPELRKEHAHRETLIVTDSLAKGDSYTSLFNFGHFGITSILIDYLFVLFEEYKTRTDSNHPLYKYARLHYNKDDVVVQSLSVVNIPNEQDLRDLIAELKQITDHDYLDLLCGLGFELRRDELDRIQRYYSYSNPVVYLGVLFAHFFNLMFNPKYKDLVKKNAGLLASLHLVHRTQAGFFLHYDNILQAYLANWGVPNHLNTPELHQKLLDNDVYFVQSPEVKKLCHTMEVRIIRGESSEP